MGPVVQQRCSRTHQPGAAAGRSRPERRRHRAPRDRFRLPASPEPRRGSARRDRPGRDSHGRATPRTSRPRAPRRARRPAPDSSDSYACHPITNKPRRQLLRFTRRRRSPARPGPVRRRPDVLPGVAAVSVGMSPARNSMGRWGASQGAVIRSFKRDYHERPLPDAGNHDGRAGPDSFGLWAGSWSWPPWPSRSGGLSARCGRLLEIARSTSSARATPAARSRARSSRRAGETSSPDHPELRPSGRAWLGLPPASLHALRDALPARTP